MSQTKSPEPLKSLEPSKYVDPKEWQAMMPMERVIHSNRNLSKGCQHKTQMDDWPQDIRDAYSFDSYFHTAHMDACRRPEVSIDECECQMCVLKIGVVQ